MSRRFIDDFDVILLDQGRTFMFGNDRFGATADYFSTYRQLEGQEMSPDHLRAVIEVLYAHLLAVCRDPSRYESFPSVARCLRELQFPCQLDEEEIGRIADVIALHELGEISERHTAAILALSQTHRLGIVSNIWAEKKRFEEKLRVKGIFKCFEHKVWSSDHVWIKPSRRLFELALNRFNVHPSRVIFVGDHPMRDIDGAGAMGCSTVWVCNGDAKFPEKLRSPNRTIRHLEELTQI
jgi:HAD superfamily hydrolase (TIGR01509 family)